MQRIPEPELMDDEAQARAYANADFEQPHSQFIALLGARFPANAWQGHVLDLGCGPADITLRFARAFPHCQIDGVDGAEAMLKSGHEAVRWADLQNRVRLLHRLLPRDALPVSRYDGIISNSLLHHLADPMVMWDTIRRYGKSAAPVFVMDLMRPDSGETAAQLVATYAGEEPEVLKRDFYHSLCAAYRPDEIATQLASAGLATLDIEIVSDRHFIVSGYLP